MNLRLLSVAVKSSRKFMLWSWKRNRNRQCFIRKSKT